MELSYWEHWGSIGVRVYSKSNLPVKLTSPKTKVERLKTHTGEDLAHTRALTNALTHTGETLQGNQDVGKLKKEKEMQQFFKIRCKNTRKTGNLRPRQLQMEAVINEDSV